MKEKKEREVKVTVIESDVLMRQILSSMLRKEEGIRLIGSTEFRSKEEHVASIRSHNPDVIMIGIDSPGSETNMLFHHVRAAFPEKSVVLLTPLTREGAKIAISGLKKGAIEYITKPDKRCGLILASRHFRKRVIPLIKAVPRLNRDRVYEPEAEMLDQPIVDMLNRRSGRARVTSVNTDLIVIGSCLGGVVSLYKIVSELPGSLPVPVVIVQHMPKIYTHELAADLDKCTHLNVREAHENSVLIPGQVYVAPGSFHSVIKKSGGRHFFALHRGPREHKCRPSIDVLLRSAVQNYGSRILAVYLSGGGNDGIQGASEVLRRGGKVLVENRESSLLWDIPSGVQALSSEIRAYPASRLGFEITRVLKSEIRSKSIRSFRNDSSVANLISGTLEN